MNTTMRNKKRPHATITQQGFCSRPYHFHQGHPPTCHLHPVFREWDHVCPTFPFPSADPHCHPRICAQKPSRSHHPMHGPVLWQDATLAELLRLHVIRRYSGSLAKEYSEVCSGYCMLECGKAFWMLKDCQKESEKNGNIQIWAIVG